MNEFTEESADELLSDLEKPAPEMAMEQPSTEGVQQATPAAQSQAAQEYAIKYGGKEIKAPLDKIIRWAEQGYEAPQKIGELNKQIESWKTKEATLKELESKYKTVDDYARENPEWFKHIHSDYENRMNQRQQDPGSQEVMQLKSMYEQQKSVLDSLVQDRENARIKNEDQKYMETFEEIKKQYPKIDFLSADHSGKTLEYKVLEYANQNKINNFKTAFKDFHFDELMKLKEEETKENLAKQKQANTKLGILGINPTPSPKSKAGYSKGKNYSDMEKEALYELGLT